MIIGVTCAHVQKRLLDWRSSTFAGGLRCYDAAVGRLIPTCMHADSGWHRRFKHDDLFPKENDGLTLLYARVSSRDQVEDLARQTDTLQAHCTEKHWSNLHTIQDIGSGLNTRKPGLRKLISLVLARKVKRLVIMHKDRLLRFANDLLLDLCRSFGVEVLVLRHEEKDAQAQWCESIVEIMTVFCSSLYGKRSHKNRRAAAVQLAP